MYLNIGQYNRLTVVKKVDFGVYLDGLSPYYPEILLPKKCLPNPIDIGDEINVFVYFDSDDRIIATTETPKICVGEFAQLKVEDINRAGAFLDWGLEKQLMVPFREQSKRFEVGKKYLVYAYLDNKNRVAASGRLTQFLDKEDCDYTSKQILPAMVMAKTTLGYKIILDSRYTAMLYSNEVFVKLDIGHKIQVKVKKIREDGKIDCLLFDKTDDDLGQTILDELANNNGILFLSDKSSPSAIYQVFGVSKKHYKKVLGKLYKEKKILITEDAIKLC